MLVNKTKDKNCFHSERYFDGNLLNKRNTNSETTKIK